MGSNLNGGGSALMAQSVSRLSVVALLRLGFLILWVALVITPFG